MKAFAVRERRARPAARGRQGPVPRPWTPALHTQRAAIRHILHGPRVQPKLKVGAPDDAYEREADRVADAVMRMPEPEAAEETPVLQRAEDTAIQRLCTECEEEVRRQPVEEEELLQAKETSGRTPEVTPDFSYHIAALRGGGRPLPESTRAFFEPRFGHDFSHVRIHTDTQAAETAKSVNARAFTMGRDVVFGSGEFAPGTPAGRRLMAHELTHVVQQRMATRDNAMTETGNVRDRDNQEMGNIDGAINYGLEATIQRDEGDKPRTDAFGKECPDTVVLAEKTSIPKFNKKMFDVGYRTYFGLVTNMEVGPKGSYESCISEVLKVVDNTCGDKGNMAKYKPCSPKKHCMKVGGDKDKGDIFTKTTFPSSPITFVDMHRTRRKFSMLEGSGKKSCKVKCLQRYGCGNKEIGRFYVTRNFKLRSFDDGKTKVPITLGTIEKEIAKPGK